MGKSWVSFLVILVLTAFEPGVSLAQEVPAGPQSALGAQFDQTMPPQFDAAASQGLANLFTSCINPAAAIGAFSNLIQKGASACQNMVSHFTIETPCVGPEGGIESGNLTCEQFSDPSGKFDPSLVSATRKSVDDALCTMSCKKAKSEAINTELNCLTNQSQILAQQVQSLQENYQRNINRMQQDVAKLKAIEEDREQQIQDVQAKLGGNGQTGEQGMLRLKEETQKMIAQMPGQIQDVKEAHKAVELQRTQLQEETEERTMSLASECFNGRTNSNFRCKPNGPPVSAKEYVVCRYEQNQQLGEDGVIETGKNVQERAAGSMENLSKLLDQMAGDSPDKGRKILPTSQQDIQNNLEAANKTVSVLTVADLENQFGSELEQFNGKGLNIHDFVVKQMGSCFKRSSRQVERERTKKGSGLGIRQEQIKAAERKNSQRVNELLNEYSQQYQANMAGLTGMNLPVDVSLCQRAAPEKQANCLDDIRSNMEGMLTGTAKNSAMAIQIKGNDPANTVAVQCRGLSGCITTLQNMSKNLTIEKSRVTQFKKDYIQRANQGVDNFTKQMTQVLGGQNDMLQKRLQKMNTALASLGVSNLINIPNIEGEELEKDEDGLVQPPKNALKLIGSKMNPPMMDMSGSNFAQAISGLGSGASDMGKQMQQLQTAQHRLAALPSTCAAKQKKASGSRAAARASATISQFEALGCTSNYRYCSNGGRETLARWFSQVADLNIGVDQEEIINVQSSLSSGSDSCNNARAPAAKQSEAGSTTTVVVVAEPDNVSQCEAIATRVTRDLNALGRGESAGGSSAGAAQ